MKKPLHVIAWILFAISIYDIAVIYLGLFWTIGETDDPEKMNTLLGTLSLNYFVGYITHLLTKEYYVRSIQKRAYDTIKPELTEVYLQMGMLISMTKMLCNTTKETDQLSAKDLEPIKLMKPEYRHMGIAEKSFIDGKPTSAEETKTITDFLLLLEYTSGVVVKYVDKIISLPILLKLDIISDAIF